MDNSPGRYALAKPHAHGRDQPVVVLAHSGSLSVTDRCEQFGIRRMTGHKHLERYGALGFAGLQPGDHRILARGQETARQKQSARRIRFC